MKTITVVLEVPEEGWPEERVADFMFSMLLQVSEDYPTLPIRLISVGEVNF
jgi:hypothetical protein